MRINIVKSIFKKEMTDILRDKKTVFISIILPILLYPALIIVLTQVLSVAVTSMEQKNLKIAFANEPAPIIRQKIEETAYEESQKDTQNEDLKNQEEAGQKEEKKGKLEIVKVEDCDKALENQDIVAYIEWKEEGGIPDYKIYMNSSVEDGQEAATRISSILEECKNEEIENKIKSLGYDKKEILEPMTYEIVNVAKSEEKAGYLLGSLLPFILIIGILSGAIYPAIDIMAGEKERGTLETLLTMPISNLELVVGKYMAVSVCAIVSAIFNIISVSCSIAYLMFTMSESTITKEMGLSNMDIGRLMVPCMITFLCICLFAMLISALSMCICAVTKSFKEAQNATSPLLLVAMVLSYASMIPNVELNAKTALIPVVNVALLIKGVLTFKCSLSVVALVLIVNILFVILSVLLLSKLFKSEEILFGQGKGFTFLQKRSDIKKGTLPTISDGLIVFSIGLMMLLYVGSILQLKLPVWGLVLTQLMIIAIPLGFAFYIKADFKETFSIKRPKVKDVVGGVILWAGMYIIVEMVAAIFLYLFPQNEETLKALNDMVMIKDNLVLNLLVVGILPGLCEEVFFRGFLYTSFKGDKHYKRAIVLSSILFGLMHVEVVKLLPTALLGAAFAYICYRSGSIFIGMLCHALNNGLIVYVMHNPQGIVGRLYSAIELDFKQLDIKQFLVLLCISVIFILIGMFILNFKSKVEKAE